MINGKRVLGIIPARGGSKGLPRKNILPLAGKPLINWSIDAAKSSVYIDRCIVSTDDKEIAEVAERHDCAVPFLRPKHLAQDDTPTIDVILHAIHAFIDEKIDFSYLVLLEPTSPLRDSHDIDDALRTLEHNREKADSIVGVSKVEATHPAFDICINSDGLIEPYVGRNFQTLRRQEIEDLYFFEGTLYISDIDIIQKEKSFYHHRTLPYIVPKWKSIEIDDIIDFICAEAIINNMGRIEC